MLSTLSSFYDPLGLASPFVMRGRKISQDLCEERLQWDETVSEMYQKKRDCQKNDLIGLEKTELKKCIKPGCFSEIVHISLHSFSDASELGYGESSNLRLVDEYRHIHCTLMMAKVKITPRKFVSIPRLELVAAVLAVKISTLIKKKLEMEELTEYLQVDRKVVLGYIANNSRAFKTFVANRVQAIQEYSSANQWNYIPSEDNPADDTSRGMTFKNFSNITKWFQGPARLCEPQSSWENSSAQEANQNATYDIEWKNQIKFCSDITKKDFVSSLENIYSCWLKLKRVIAFILKWKVNHHRKQSMLTGENNKVTINFANENLHILDISQIQQAERCIIKLVQSKYFNEEMKKLLMKKQGSEEAEIKKSSQIYNLDPHIDEDGIIRVGGRLKIGQIEFEQRM